MRALAFMAIAIGALVLEGWFHHPLGLDKWNAVTPFKLAAIGIVVVLVEAALELVVGAVVLLARGSRGIR